MSRFNQFLNSKAASFVLPFSVTVFLFVLWEVLTRLLKIPAYNLPAPSAIVSALITRSQPLIENALQTLMTTLVGFFLSVIAGVLLGFLIGCSKVAYKILYPILVGFNTIPKVALVPLFALWFGIGSVPAILTAFLLAFFPIAVNIALGLDTVEPEMRDVLRSLGASRMEFLKKIGIPHTMPYLFASLKVAVSFAFIGSVISETVASNKGIGYLVISASSSFDVPLAFAGLLILSAMGVVLYAFFAALEKYVIHWAR
jgi:NitT/TauT family transport system permease protein